MENVNYKFFGREASNWQKKYFFKEIGRGGNPDSAFLLLLASQRGRSPGASKSPGAELFARLVKQYGLSHLTDDPRTLVRRLVDIVSAEAAEAKSAKIELAAGFLHMKGDRAAAGSVGRLRAGLADRETLVATSSLPESARQKGGLGQVALDLGHTVEGNLKETPSFFIVPSSATAMGEEPLRNLLWEYASGGIDTGNRPPEGWQHLPCLIGASSRVFEEERVAPRTKTPSRIGSTQGPASKKSARQEPVPTFDSKASASGGPSIGLNSSTIRRALWVGFVAVAAFLVIKFGVSGSDRSDPPLVESAAPAGYVADETRIEVPIGSVADEVRAEGLVEEVGGAAAGAVAVEVTEDRGAGPTAMRSLWSAKLGGVLTSSPVEVGESVAFGSRDGTVYCLRKKDGGVSWRFKGPDGFGSSPAFDKDRIYIGCYNGAVLCLKAGDGLKVWSYGTGGKVVSSPAISGEGDVLVGSYDGYLYCLTPDGKLRWRFNSGARVWASPVYSNGKVFFGDLTGRVHCLDASTGKAIWSKAAPGAIYGSPATDGERVYFGSSDGTVVAYSMAGGTQLWSRKGPKGVTSSIGMISGDLVVGYEGGSVERLSSKDGTRAWGISLSGTVRSRPVPCSETVAITCFDGHVYLLNPSNGSTVSSYEAEGKVYCTPLISSDAAYFGDMKGNFTALDVASF